MPGPPPTPTALKVLRGNPGKRSLNRDEPKPPPSTLEPPAWLKGDAIALRIWQEEAPRLQQLGLLGSIDRLLFAALCERAALYRRAARLLRGRRGLTQATKSGEVTRPEVSISRGALESVRRLAASFGMTPADRARLMVEPPAKPSAKSKAASKWAGLLS